MTETALIHLHRTWTRHRGGISHVALRCETAKWGMFAKAAEQGPSNTSE